MATEYDLFADVYDHQYGTTTFDLDFYVEEAKAAQPPVLELACGTGRVTLNIAQAGVPVLDDDDVESLRARILVEEHRLYPEVLQLIAEGRVTRDGRRVRIVAGP